MALLSGETYFTHDKEFYKTLFRVLLIVSLQNIVNYSVNMVDNLMLGTYGQVQLSGAACVNQIFFILQSFMNAAGATLSILAAQFWGKKDTAQINHAAAIAFRFTLITAAVFFVVSALIPEYLIRIFTSDPQIIEQGCTYLGIIKFTFFPYAISCVFIDLLRNVETTFISFVISVVSLTINALGNYAFIFGNFGCPELGIAGAAWSTLIARIAELLILVIFVAKFDKKLNFFHSDFLKTDKELFKKYRKIYFPILVGNLAFAIGTPVQSAMLGAMTSDAIAANAVTSTFYQYVKVIAQAMYSSTALVIGMTLGKGFVKEVRACARTIELICLGMGLCLAGVLFLISDPLLSLYTLTPEALRLSRNLIIIMCFVMIGMSYEVPVLFGVIRSGGNASFTSTVNMVFMWGIAIPLTVLAMFVWHLSAEWIVIFMQSDQILKCIPAFIRLRQYDKWIHIIEK